MLKSGLFLGVIAAMMFVGCGDKDPLSSTVPEGDGSPAAVDDSPNGVAPGEPNPGGGLSYSQWKADLPEDLNKDGMVDHDDFVLFLERPIPVDFQGGIGGGVDPLVYPLPVDKGEVPDVHVDPIPVDSGDDTLPVDVIKVAVRGHITVITEADTSGQERGIIGSALIAGEIEKDTEFDKAVVEITRTTRISERDGEGFQMVSFESLQAGQKVEATFTGAVRESYPVQVAAMELIVLK